MLIVNGTSVQHQDYHDNWNNTRTCSVCEAMTHHPAALSKLLKREGRAGAEGAILPYVGHLQLISTLKIGADCCQLCQYKLTKPNQT